MRPQASFAFPVYRRGELYQPADIVSVRQADAVAKRITAEPRAYELAFRSAARRAGGVHLVISKDETLQEAFQESHILNFPEMFFDLKDYSLSARTSITVCMHEHRSKLWIRLTCRKIKGHDASGLGPRAVRAFFSAASRFVDVVLPSVAATYKGHLRGLVKRIPRTCEYSFQLRAFNSTSRTSAAAYKALLEESRLSDLLKRSPFAEDLLAYFSVVSAKTTSANTAVREVRAGRLECFGYASVDHHAIYTVQTTRRMLDLCGYGYDARSGAASGSLAHSTTRDLLKEYARRF
jgi:hypothetical protein